jgi:hypothetical protein
VDGPPASSLRKAVMTCVLPSLLYGTEAWYAGRMKPARYTSDGRPELVSARLGWHVSLLNKTRALAIRGVLPVWRTTPTATLFRDAGLPSASRRSTNPTPSCLGSRPPQLAGAAAQAPK